jgi:GTP-binding protein
LKPQKVDLQFMSWLGWNRIPFVIVFTKMDKLSSSVVNKNITQYKKELLKEWEALPMSIVTSSITKFGRDEIWKLIEDTNKTFS